MRKIISSMRPPGRSHVVEIGPGTGALTAELIEHHDKLTALEIDSRAVRLLRRTHPTLDVRHLDVLDVNWQSLADEKGGPIYVVANLPYNITSQVLIGLIDAGEALSEAVLMMQLEVAQRLVARPRTKEYGILSVQVQLHCEPKLLFKVSPNVFFPRPDVYSAVVRLDFTRRYANLDAADPDVLRDVIRSAFNQRRKTLHNSLGKWTRDRHIELPGHFRNRRAEELTPAEFVELAHYLGSRVNET